MKRVLLILGAWAVSAIASPALMSRAEEEQEPAGSPGLMTVPDNFNTALGVEWNRTYGQTEPQQIHLSFGSDSKYARIQFATLSPIDQAVLKYWPKNRHASTSNKPVTQLKGEV